MLLPAGTWDVHLYPRVRALGYCVICRRKKDAGYLVCMSCYTNKGYHLYITEEVAARVELAENFLP